MKLIKLSVLLFFLGNVCLYSQTDPSLNITIGTDSIATTILIDPPYTPKPKVTLENSVFKAVIRLNDGGYENVETAFKDITIKSKNSDIVNQYVDACSQRPAADTAYITYDGTDKKTVRLEFLTATRSGMIDYTIYPNSPKIKIDYLEYEYGGWANIVDMLDLGYRNPRIYGEESFLRTIDTSFYPKSYWNTYDEPYKSTDPTDGGTLNYNGYSIMLYGGDTTSTSYGFGRILPFFTMNTNGGMRILKLLDWGFEPYSSTGNNASNRKPFTGFIYVWDTGQNNAITTGQSIIDDYLDSLLPVELVSFNASADADSVTLVWSTATEVNNYGFSVQRKNHSLGETNWSDVDFISGHGNSNTPHDYSYIDNNLQPGTYSYRLKQVDTNGGAAYSDTLNVVVSGVLSTKSHKNRFEFYLNQNYPNPFNPETNIRFSLPEQGNVKIKIYNSLGSFVETLTDEVYPSGINNIKFKGQNLASGIYFYALEYNSIKSQQNYRLVKKMILLK